MTSQSSEPRPVTPSTPRLPSDERRASAPMIALVLGLAWLAAANCRAPLLALGPLLPLIIADLGLSSTVAGALSGLPLLLMGALSIPGGLVADRLGPRRLLVASQLAIAVAAGLRGLTGEALLLLGASIALGGAIGMGQPALAQVARAVSHRRAGLATAVYANGLMLGAMMALSLTAPLLLPLIGDASWRGVLLLWASIGLVTALGWTLVRLPGYVPHRPGRASTMPLRQVLAIPGLAPTAVVFAAQGAIFYALATWLPEFYVARGWSLAATAAPLAALSAFSILGGMMAPGFAVWWGGPRRPLILGGLVTVAGQVGLPLAPDAAALWMAAVGVGSSMGFTLGLAAPAELAPREKVGAAAGFLLAVGYVGAMLGPLGFGVLRDLSDGFGPSLAFLVALGAIMTLAAVAIPSAGPAPSPPTGAGGLGRGSR